MYWRNWQSRYEVHLNQFVVLYLNTWVFDVDLFRFSATRCALTTSLHPPLPLRLVMRMTKERKGRGWVRPMNLFPSYLPFISLSAPGSPRSGPKWRSPEKNGCFVILFLVQSNSKQNILWMKLRVGSNNLNNLLDFDRSFTWFFFSSFCRSWCQG